jgi:hypothetical protein
MEEVLSMHREEPACHCWGCLWVCSRPAGEVVDLLQLYPMVSKLRVEALQSMQQHVAEFMVSTCHPVVNKLPVEALQH